MCLNLRPFRPCYPLLTSQRSAFHSSTPPRSLHGHQVLAVLESCRSPALTLGQRASWCRPPFPSTSSPGFLHILLGLPLYCPCQFLSLACTPPFFLFKSCCCSGLCHEPSALHTLHSFPGTRIYSLICAHTPQICMSSQDPPPGQNIRLPPDIPFRSLADTVTSTVPTFTPHLYFLPSLYMLLFRDCHYLLILSCPSPKSGI